MLVVLKFQEYEQVVLHDRMEIEKAELEEGLELRMVKASTKVQAWWRGTMVG